MIQDKKYTKEEFLRSIRSKYPQYDNIEDDVLYNKILEKYPVYRDQISEVGDVLKKKEDSTLAQEDTDSTPKVDSSDTPKEELPVRNDFLSSFKDLAPFMIPGASALYEMFSDADYENAIETGKAQGYAVEEISASMFSDKIKTKEDAQKFINAANQLQKVGPSENYKKFQKRTAEYEKEGYGDFSSTLLALGETPEVATETILQSFVAMGPAIMENPVDMLKAIGTGALTGLAAGGPGGAFGGAIAGSRVGLNVILDSSLSSIEFVKEELEGKDFTPENILEVMNDKEKYDRIISRSLVRGGTIGATEAILGKFSSGISNVLGKAAGEVAAGGVGEAAAQVASGQEINAQEIILESVGGILGVPSAVIESKTNKIYKINGERVSEERARSAVDNLKPEEIKDVKIESNDEAFINETKEKKKQDETAKPAEGNRLFSEPLQDATTVAERFAERTGRTFETPEPISEIDQEKAKSIGEAYEKMESNPTDPEVQRAYEAMINETVEQYKDIVESGYQVEINDQEPYKSSTDMIEDLRNNKNMKIFSTESGFGKEGITDEQRASNPLLKDSGFTDKNGKKLLMNDVFRFVHDYFGHSKLGNSFGPIGEENAWRVHSAMYSPLARKAMTSETRGQNSWVNFSGVNDEAFKLRDEAREIRKKAEQLPEDSPERKKMLTDAFEKVQQVYEKMRFADQKIGLLPDEMVELTEEEVSQTKTEEAPSKERAESIIDGIIKKTEARLTPDVDPKKKLSNVLSYLQENSKLYEELNDSQREKMVIDLTKKIGIPVESSPQIRTVLGIKKEAPVTIKVKPFEEFKKRLRELEKVSREAVKFTKKQQAERKKAIVGLVKELRKKGRLSSAQQQVILNRVTSAVIDDKNFDNTMSYVRKVYDNAELAEKLRSIVALQKRSFGKRKKKNIQTKLGVAPQLYPQVEKIATMDVRNLNLDKVDDMLDVLSVLGERKAVLDLAKLKDMSGKIENILSDENVAPEVTPQQTQAIEEDNEFMREEFNSITEEEFDSLPEKLKRNIGRTRANVAAGFMSPDAIDVIKEVNATRSSKVVLEKINPNKFLDAIAFSNKLRTFLNKSNNLYLSKIRSNSTRYIDDILGNVKGYEIYKNTFEPLSKAYGKLQGDLEVFSAKKQEAIRLIAGKNLTKKANEVTKSSVKMKLTALQFEFEFNENDKSTAKATDWLDATIEHMKEKDFSEHEVKFYEDIKKEFLSDEKISAEQLYSKLSDNEKKAYKIMQDANSDLVGKMLFTSAAVRGERPKTYNSYTYHDVLYSDNEYKGIVENKFQTLISQKPSTKAGTIIDRQPGVRAINLDIFSSSENGARQTLTDYHMTMPVRTLYSAIGKMKKTEGLTGKKRKAVSAISKAVDESLRNVFERDHARSSSIEQAFDFLAKVGYRAALGSLPRASSELLSNMEYVMIRNPKDFTKGMASLKQMTSVDGLKLFKSLGSVHTARLFGAQDQVSAFSGKTAFNRLDKNPSKVKSEIYNKAEFIVNAINNVSDTTSYINDTLIQSGDKAISKPLWFGSFINKFQELTGVTPDLQKLSENDSDYFKKYSKEIKDSTFYADENVNAAATSLNPFDSILKLQQKQGGDAMSVAKRIYVMADAFMARFTINEYMQSRRAIHSLVYDGKMTKKQAAATLAGTTARMSTYMLLYGLLRDQMRELFGIEPEEDDKMDLLKRQTVGSILGLLSRGTSGNIPMVFINYGLERANENYMESLRSYEDYDPYKHSIVFSQVTKDEIERGDYLRIGADVLAGPYTYPLNVGLKTGESYSRMKGSARISTSEKYKEKLKYVHSIELLGMLNVLPFYKDIRDIAVRKFMQKYPYRGKK